MSIAILTLNMPSTSCATMLPYGQNEGSSIINAPLIKALLKAALLPVKAGVIHCRRHQNPLDSVVQGNALGDKTAKGAAEAPVSPRQDQYFPFSSIFPIYSSSENSLYPSLPTQGK
ncbi:hypothetical protein AAY473_015772 [Plecturocebus cupreus]